MKLINHIGAQGELLLIRVDSIPTGTKSVKPECGRLVVGHSETGHHHAIDLREYPEVNLFDVPTDALDGYIEVGMPFADLVHMRDYDTHETLRLPEGKYQIRRQREHTIEGWRPVLD